MANHIEREIIQWIREGDLKEREKAFEMIYRQYYSTVQKMIIQNSGTEDDVKDVFQDGVIVLYNQIQKGNFRADSSLKTYLYSICRNLWLKKLKKNKHTTEINDTQQFADDSENAIQNLQGTEREQCIEQLLNQLGEECNKILKFFYYDKLSMKKIMQELGFVSEQVAKNKKMKCLKRLRKQVLESAHYTSLLKHT